MTPFQLYLLGAVTSMCLWLFKTTSTKSTRDRDDGDYMAILWGMILSWLSVLWFVVSATGSKVRSGKFLDF